VSNYREEANTSSHVSFKLVTVPTTNRNGTFAYVLIRGTTNNWDMLTDAQLWSAAALMQVLRELLPVGSAWTPIIHKLIDAITFVESESLQKVSFYKDTTKFVEYVKTLGYAGIAITGESKRTFHSFRKSQHYRIFSIILPLSLCVVVGWITGHSLGGGLSIITGAQTGVPAVALSGPNAMLSRQSFEPKITQEDLDSKTFVSCSSPFPPWAKACKKDMFLFLTPCVFYVVSRTSFRLGMWCPRLTMSHRTSSISVVRQILWMSLAATVPRALCARYSIRAAVEDVPSPATA